MDSINIGKKIRELRLDEGLTLEQLANSLRIKKNMLSNYELGKSSISADLLTKIADYFNTSLDYLTSRNTQRLQENTNCQMIECCVYAHLYSYDISNEINTREIMHTISLPDYYIEKGKYFGLKITDESLNLKNIYRGAVAITKMQTVARTGELVVYIYKNNKAHYGIYSITDENIIISPCSSESSYTPAIFNITDTDFKIIGKISMILGPVKTK